MPVIIMLLAALAAVVIMPSMSACNQQNPTPTPMPSPTAISSPTPTAATESPAESNFRKVELDPNYRPAGVLGDEYVSAGPDGEIYLLNPATGAMRQLTNDGHRKRSPVISADYLAWIDHRRQIEISGIADQYPESWADDIFVLNLATGEQKRITEAPAERRGLRISGHRLIWQDTRNEIGEYYTHADIYAYDLKTNREIPIAVAKGAQRSPDIYGNMAVWMDNRISPWADDPESGHSGCADCPDNRFDIYIHDFTADESKPLIQTGYFNAYPQIHNDYVVWHAYQSGKNPVIKLLNLATGSETEIMDASQIDYGPSISDNYLVWSSGFPCDVVDSRAKLDWTGAYARNMTTGEVWKLSNYVEPIAVVYGNIAFITEGCQVPTLDSVYAVFLE